MERTYYETLGVTKASPPEEINKRYRKLAKEFHPDRNPGDENATLRYREVSEAYEVLSDPILRSQYDLQGYVGRRRPSPPPQHPHQYRPRAKPKKPDKPPSDWHMKHVHVFTKEELDAVKCQFFGGSDRILLGRHILVTLVIKPEERGRSFEIAIKKRRQCNSCEAGNCEELDNWLIEKFPVVVPTDHRSGNHIVLRGRGEKGRGSGGHAGNVHVAVIIQ
jgi:DnaJ-class molecular chaperone